MAPNYPCEFVRTESLKEKYGSKVTTILNLFYSGYTPDWFYIRQPGKSTLRGPMGDYHNKTIFEAWLANVNKSEVLSLVRDVKYNSSKHIPSLTESLLNLKQREHDVDVAISDYLEAHLMDKRLFFTFNHPTLELLTEYSERLLVYLGINQLNQKIELAEPLNQYIPDINVGLPFTFERTGKYVGNKVLEINGWDVLAKYRGTYNLEGIVDLYYQIYDTNRDKLILLYGKKP